MQVSEENIKAWAELKERHDVRDISKILGISVQNTNIILKTGKGSITQISCIQKFYKNRKKKIAKIDNDLN